MWSFIDDLPMKNFFERSHENFENERFKTVISLNFENSHEDLFEISFFERSSMKINFTPSKRFAKFAKGF